MMAMNTEIWRQFNDEIFTDEYPDGSGSCENLIWQKPNGQWVMLIADPLTPGRVIQVAARYNPWTGEALPAERQEA